MIHNCKGLKEHNLILVEEKGIVNAYSKYYSMWDKTEDQPPDEDWYMSLQGRDYKYCPYCGELLHK